MSKAIWKYEGPTPQEPRRTIDMPAKAEVVTVGHDPIGVLSIWALVDPDCPTTPRHFRLVGTGHLINGNVEYLGAVLDRPFVWHILEEK